MAVVPPRDDHRIIIHFDYDCFYASVFEVEQPVLKTLPLAVQQKQIVVTCNYEARRRGLRKLQLIKEARQICPELVIVLGEDLTKFRDASKSLYLFLRAFCWSGQVEKLGFDELFLDVTDMITYNVDLLNRNDLEHSFFHLNRQDPTLGFAFDATGFHGSTYPAAPNVASDSASPCVPAGNDPHSLHIRLLVASHLAAYLRGQLEEQKGYTATVGISTSKILAKLVGNIYKPNNQTTLLPPYTAAEQGAQSNVLNFLDAHDIRKIPGIGSKLSRKLTSYLKNPAQSSLSQGASDTARDDTVTVRDVRLFPRMGPVLLDKILGGPGSPKGIGTKVWSLIHGVDNSEVLQARDLPTQISIEDSYGGLSTFEEVRRELVSLTASLIRRMRADLTEEEPDVAAAADSRSKGSLSRTTSTMRWIARPRTLRLSTRPRPPPTSSEAQSHSFNRISRSAPLPQYVFYLDASIDALAEQLVHELVTSMFRKLHPEKAGWNIRLLNVAVTNMVDAAGERKQSSGRDIEKMFQRQDMGRRPDFPVSVTGRSSPETGTQYVRGPRLSSSDTSSSSQIIVGLDRNAYKTGGDSWEESDEDEDMPCVACTSCGALIPHFALVAHEVYHSAPD
ncbi:DNA polymerase iota [Aspergillus flavus]|uniref:DNA polymerase iota n=1 Tax=Aspergillus flavus (strain ATCC 200026 / FGSC A1120 / IAM 13836 / NRRL 3357 / JCM 12722 / SRRC 167) TaxID=332952 RepID=A0A7U2MFX2_ASPFN|nr:hypothetical protein AFLA_000563 [Aspergillus flavus NRRL3357]QRD82981.1 DNA polymerase iota [Aspergillus flavus]UDD56510.1 hypothetical protein AFCA_004046 [Aspergillus flavus]